MALTPQQEQQIANLLSNYSGIQDLADSSTQILAALGYDDVRVIDLPSALALQANDMFYLAQNSQDVKATIQQLSNFVVAEILPSLQSQIQSGLADNKFYFFGQF